MDAINLLLEVMRAWTSLEGTERSIRLLIVYAAMALIEDGTVCSEVPYISIVGERDSKKTQALALVVDLVGEELSVFVTAGVTHAVFFRLINKKAARLVAVDEADELPAGTAREINRVARAGYRQGAVVYRCGGPDGVEPFKVYGCKIFSRINPERDVALKDRTIELRAVPSQESAFKFSRASRDAAVGSMRAELMDFAEANREIIRTLYAVPGLVHSHLVGRLASIGIPLALVARRLDERWPGLGFEEAVIWHLTRERDRRRGYREFESREICRGFLRAFLNSGNKPVEKPDLFLTPTVLEFLERKIPKDAGLGRSNNLTRRLYDWGLACAGPRRGTARRIRLKVSEIMREDFNDEPNGPVSA